MKWKHGGVYLVGMLLPGGDDTDKRARFFELVEYSEDISFDTRGASLRKIPYAVESAAGRP